MGVEMSNNDCTARAFFETKDDCKGCVEVLRATLDSQGLYAELRAGVLEDEDWITAWHDYFKPLEIGERFLIHPPGYSPACESGRIEIEINPGQTFGTGNHESTRLCLRMLEYLEMEGKKVIDAGCGSGILSIASLKLGADRIVGFDIDPLAALESRFNAKVNQVGDWAIWVTGSVQSIKSGWADLIIANLDRSILLSNAELAGCLSPLGSIILSGFMVRDSDLICRQFSVNNLRVSQEITEGEWACLCLTGWDRDGNDG